MMPSKRLGAKTGGRMVFDRAGNLLMPLGDRSDSPPWDVAQKMDTHLGKIIRIAPDGTVPADNPFVGQARRASRDLGDGTRSVEGLAYDPRTGKLWQNDHGPRGGDELNIIEKGKNYGWPIVARGIDYPGAPIGVTTKDGMEEPVYFWDPVIGPSGLAFYTGNLFPQWKNSMFVGGLRGAHALAARDRQRQSGWRKRRCSPICARASATCASGPTARCMCSPTAARRR